ncbi:SpoIIE family protein phosphatase [Streptomyces sp. NPDC050704]|uniref:ATP-binding SpoIIE family protein phosphatase n=1 Tax=Streptomyces sp. NPDC050704 TaxID=3157219 RepID=UPI0034404EA6
MTAVRAAGRPVLSPVFLVSLGVCLLIAVLDVLADGDPQIVALLVIGPLLACTRLDVRHTVLVGCWAALAGVAAGLLDGTFLTLAFAVRWCGVLLGCALTVYGARKRAALEAALRSLALSRQATKATQAAILQPLSRMLDGTHVCTRYHSATEESGLGGDVYDVAQTPFGLRVLIADVCGHGLDAVRLTAAVVTGFRELAYTTERLPELTAALDARLAPELGPEDFVTAVLAEFAPGEVRLVNCGHPAPLRCSGQDVELLEPAEPTLPLGLRPNPRQDHFSLESGDRLLFYTDGLTGARDAQGTPFPLLGEAPAALPAALPEEALRSLYTRVLRHAGQLTDDLALVLCQPVEAGVAPAWSPLVAAAVWDGTDRQAAESRVNDLTALVESSHDAILAKTLDGRITYWNAAAERLYGHTSEEAIGTHVSFLAPPDRKDEIDELLDRLSRGEKIEHFETIRVTATGARLDVDVTLWPTRAPDGQIVGASAIVRDVSAQKRVEAELTALYERQRHIALTLQRSLMGIPPEIPGMPTAHRYLPATQGAGVGGDWFDLVPLGAGRVGALIGDVMGRGLTAAVVMGQLRSAAHALARSGMPPRQLMHTLEAVVADLPGQPDQFITCCYVEIDPGAGEATICSAGHLPPLLATPDAAVRTLPVPVSVPLGVGEIPHEQVTVPIPVGSTLVLCTDGLVETPGCDIDSQLDALAAALGTAFATEPGLEEAADHALAELLPDGDGPYDDVTLLLVRLPSAPLATARLDLAAVPAAVTEGRAFLTEFLASWNCPHDVTDDARLLASELLTNAVFHAGGPIGLRLRHTAHELTVEVTDRSPHLPHQRSADAADESGRGLAIVDALADSWGTHATEDGKTTWFTLSTGSAAAAGVAGTG